MRGFCNRMLSLVGLAILPGMLGCGRDHQPSASAQREPSAVAQPNLTQAISAVGGTYTWHADLNRYQYSEKARLEEILAAQNRDAVVPMLVECLDDPSPSRSTIDGRPVAVGIVCYEALTQLIYYEPPAPGGDVAASWAGHISPQASPERMREAKEAWKTVVAAKSFIFL